MQKSTPQTEERGKVPQVIHDHDQTGSRRYRVLSLSQPGTYRYVDLDANDGAGACTCPATVPGCRHRKLARQYEATEGAEFVIERRNDWRLGGKTPLVVYGVFEVRGESRRLVSERPNFYDALLDREELYRGAA